MAYTENSSLPLEVVEHIQTYMNFKEAARSATLCKRLHDAWLKLEKLDLDESLFDDSNEFWAVAIQTLGRYAGSNQYIQSMVLQIFSGVETQNFFTELIDCAAALSVNEVEIRMYNADRRFFIPGSLFESDGLRKLTVVGGVMDEYYDIPSGSNTIKSLVLLPDIHSGLRGDLIINYLMHCPMIEELTCTGQMLGIDHDIIGQFVHDLSMLNVERLHCADIYFMKKFIKFFPNLKCLTVSDIYDHCVLSLQSTSIEILAITDESRPVTARIDAPRLRKFKFVGVTGTSIKFVSTRSDLEVELVVHCTIPNFDWFKAFRALLGGLGRAKLNVTVVVSCNQAYFKSTYDDDGYAIEVDNLVLKTNRLIPGMVECLFHVCIPHNFSYKIMQAD